MQPRLALSLNDDGTVTLRCDADAFFAHADEIRRLLSGGGAPAGGEERDEDPAQVAAFWSAVFPGGATRGSRDLSAAGTAALVAGYYLTRVRGLEAFTHADLSRVLGAAGRPERPPALPHLARRGWLERARRGAYALSRRAVGRVESLRDLARRPGRPTAAQPPAPRTSGLSRFLREVPAVRKWRRVLLVAYFLREHCGVAELDQDLLRAAFRRARGVEAPGSLGGLMSQVLCKRHGLLERGTRRGSYRLTARALEELGKDPRVARADALHRAQAAREGEASLAS
ncbi:MAG: hypothetical protein M9894_34265 [Planctomycetes bacterium]|nr:hypothetical protein [Planctomycetota bacterium]